MHHTSSRISSTIWIRSVSLGPFRDFVLARHKQSARGKRAWVTYLDPDTSRRLKAAAAMSDRSMQSLGVEAAELLIERYGTR